VVDFKKYRADFFEAEPLIHLETGSPLSAQMQLLYFRARAAKLHNRCNRG